ncbi:hypothetical protein PIB30_090581 [Stylosanthes scabra]|uniref:Uncharacterized protein n=1 Tax=Stylosanthes scabra TaxID=79078 RepID=A0ABU6YUM4_9FABA|nr:hypothetical protein [Stylosanthes scabra]
MDKQSRFDRLRAKMAAVEVPLGASSGTVKPRKKTPVTTSLKPISLEKEEGDKEDPCTDLKQKKRKRKDLESISGESALGADSSWEHKVNPIDRAFPVGYDFRAAIDSGLTQGPTREILGPMPPEQLLGTAQFLAYKLTAGLQVGIENAFAVKVGLEKELAATKDQVDVLTAGRDSTLAAPLLTAKINSLTEELKLAESEHFFGLAGMKEVEEGAKAQAVELQSYRSTLEQERKKVEAEAEGAGEFEVAAVYWRKEWKGLADETEEMVQETFDILMDQVRHLNPAIDYLMITLDTRWDPKAKRIYNPKDEVQEQSKLSVEDQPELVVDA